MDTTHIDTTGYVDVQACASAGPVLYITNPGQVTLQIEPDGTWNIVDDATRAEIERK